MKFPIPSSFQDLERDPYGLLPYPLGFADDDEVTRADSFDQLVLLLERGNLTLAHGSIEIFETSDGTTDQEGGDIQEWNCEDRIQALYTLVRYVLTLLFHDHHFN
jgi:condensin complex subunit 1